MYRDHTKEVQIGNVTIGGGNPIRIQSMTNTKTEDVEATVTQILELEAAGCDRKLAVRSSAALCRIWMQRKQLVRSRSRFIFHLWQIFILIISWRLQRLRTGQIRFVLIRVILEMSRESVLLLKKPKSTVFQFVLV